MPWPMLPQMLAPFASNPALLALLAGGNAAGIRPWEGFGQTSTRTPGPMVGPPAPAYSNAPKPPNIYGEGYGGGPQNPPVPGPLQAGPPPASAPPVEPPFNFWQNFGGGPGAALPTGSFWDMFNAAAPGMFGTPRWGPGADVSEQRLAMLQKIVTVLGLLREAGAWGDINPSQLAQQLLGGGLGGLQSDIRYRTGDLANWLGTAKGADLKASLPDKISQIMMLLTLGGGQRMTVGPYADVYQKAIQRYLGERLAGGNAPEEIIRYMRQFMSTFQ